MSRPGAHPAPHFEGIERFEGLIVHPQHWPEDLDYRGRRVVVIGSGATAVTLVPAMAGAAAHVTVLQRTPTYVLPVPSTDKIAHLLRKVLGRRRGYAWHRARYAPQWPWRGLSGRLDHRPGFE